MKKRVSIICLIGLMCLPLMFMSCREKSKEVPTTPEPELVVKESLAPQYAEIAAFMNLSLTDSTEVNEVLTCKALFNRDSLADSDAEDNLKLYKNIMRNGRSTALPIFESRTSDLSLVLLTGKGYVGPIWAEVLFDRQTLEIKKVRFDHKMESEGYGDNITEAAFEEQFAGGVIRLDGNIYALKQVQDVSSEGITAIDGVSGATATSTAVVQMLNAGFRDLAPYFPQEK